MSNHLDEKVARLPLNAPVVELMELDEKAVNTLVPILNELISSTTSVISNAGDGRNGC